MLQVTGKNKQSKSYFNVVLCGSILGLSQKVCHGVGTFSINRISIKYRTKELLARGLLCLHF